MLKRNSLPSLPSLPNRQRSNPSLSLRTVCSLIPPYPPKSPDPPLRTAAIAKEGGLKEVPKKSNRRFVIYVKKGIYNENVRVEKNMWNVMVVGDGKGATLVSGSLNAVDGTPTFETATFAVFGRGFVARDMGFRNTAGARKHQAVAMMASTDKLVFYRCLLDAFQKTKEGGAVPGISKASPFRRLKRASR